MSFGSEMNRNLTGSVRRPDDLLVVCQYFLNSRSSVPDLKFFKNTLDMLFNGYLGKKYFFGNLSIPETMENMT